MTYTYYSNVIFGRFCVDFESYNNCVDMQHGLEGYFKLYPLIYP